MQIFQHLGINRPFRKFTFLLEDCPCISVDLIYEAEKLVSSIMFLGMFSRYLRLLLSFALVRQGLDS